MNEDNIFSKLWDKLVPQKGTPNTIQGKLVWAIGRLEYEWRNNGNGNWDRVDFYLDMIEQLWDVLVYEEPIYDEEDTDEMDITPPENFDIVKNEQIKQDLRLIEMLGMLVKLHLDGEQSERVLQLVSSEESTGDEKYSAAFNRVKQNVVDWCQSNPFLREYLFQSLTDSNKESIGYIFE